MSTLTSIVNHWDSAPGAHIHDQFRKHHYELHIHETEGMHHATICIDGDEAIHWRTTASHEEIEQIFRQFVDRTQKQPMDWHTANSTKGLI